MIVNKLVVILLLVYVVLEFAVMYPVLPTILDKETIEKMLKSYKGTVIFVSHDRYFVRKISDSLLSLDNGVATYYPYGYSQYISKKEDRTFVIREEVKKEKPEVKKEKAEKAKEEEKEENTPASEEDKETLQ